MSLCNLLSAALSDAFDASRSCKHVCAFRLMECQSDDGHFLWEFLATLRSEYEFGIS